MPISTQANQTPVPPSRTWTLVRGKDSGLVADGPGKSIQVGEALLFAFDFSRDLTAGSIVSSITSIAVEGATSEVTFDTAEQGLDRGLVKLHITGASAGSIRVRATVVYSDGSAVEGDGALKIVDA